MGRTPAPLNGWALQLNKNPLGFTCGALQCADCAPGATVETLVPLTRNPAMASGQPLQAPIMLQAAVKTSMDIFYFNVPVDLSCVLEPRQVDQATFLQAWAAMEPRQAGVVRRSQSKLVPDNVVRALTSNFIQHVFSSSNDQADSIYLAGACGSANFFALVALQKAGALVQVACGVNSRLSLHLSSLQSTACCNSFRNDGPFCSGKTRRLWDARWDTQGGQGQAASCGGREDLA